MRPIRELLLLLSLGCALVSLAHASDRSSESRALDAGTKAVAQSDSATIGTPHPLVVQRVSPDGRWVAACQARADTDGSGTSTASSPEQWKWCERV